MRIWRLAAMAAALTVSVVASAQAQSTLRIGLAEDPDMLDPSLGRTYVGRIVFSAFCDKLFDIDEKLNIVPQLALSHETSAFGLAAALGGVVLIGLAAWAYQKSNVSSGKSKLTVLITAAVSLLLAIFLPVHFADNASAAAVEVSSSASGGADAWQPYSAAKVAELKAAGKPLLVNFTASWCLTCLVNERNAFSDAAVQKIFHDRNVTLMKGDWTNNDPAITHALSEFGRAGVPLYLVYNGKPGTSEPEILPQILTASVVQGAFSSAATP